MGLSYHSSKFVLEHLEANRRYQLVSRCPSLRNLHKLVPIHINCLKLTSTSFVLNQVEHRFLTCRVHPPGELLSYNMMMDRLRVGNDFDVDQYGFQEPEIVDVKPGDVVIWDQEDPDERDWTLPEQDPSRQKYNFHVKCVFKSEIRDREKSVSLPQGLKIRDVIRKHLGNILQGPTVINRLKISILWGVVRIPEGLRFRVRNLICRAGLPDQVPGFIDPESFPLKSLRLGNQASTDIPNFNQPFRKMPCEMLHIEIRNWLSNDWVDVLKALPNRNIHVSKAAITQDLMNYVNDWIQNPRPIGHRFSIQTAHVQDRLTRIIEETDVVKGVLKENRILEFRYCGTIRVGADSELNIFGDKSPNSEKELTKEEGEPWSLVFEVMKLGSATRR